MTAMTRRQILLDLLNGGRSMRMPEIAVRLGIPAPQANAFLSMLLKTGVVERTGTRRNYMYQMRTTPFVPPPKPEPKVPGRLISSVFDLGLPA